MRVRADSRPIESRPSSGSSIRRRPKLKNAHWRIDFGRPTRANGRGAICLRTPSGLTAAKHATRVRIVRVEGGFGSLRLCQPKDADRFRARTVSSTGKKHFVAPDPFAEAGGTKSIGSAARAKLSPPALAQALRACGDDS